MEPADDIFARHGTDKSFEHHYGPHYDTLFPTQESRDAVKAVLEIGVARGNSLMAWREIFPNAIVVGLDMTPDVPRPLANRLEIHMGDQSHRDSLKNAAKGRLFDLIVDDGSHRIEHQLTGLFHLWPNVKSGGHYVVEEFDMMSNDRCGAEDHWESVGLLNGARLAIGAAQASKLLIVSKG